MSSIAEDIAAKNRLDRKMEIAQVIRAGFVDHITLDEDLPSDEECEAIAEEILALSERFNRKPKVTKTKATKTK